MNRVLCAVPDCSTNNKRITNTNRAPAKSILPFLSTQELEVAEWVHRSCKERYRLRGRRTLARSQKDNGRPQATVATSPSAPFVPAASSAPLVDSSAAAAAALELASLSLQLQSPPPSPPPPPPPPHCSSSRALAAAGRKRARSPSPSPTVTPPLPPSVAEWTSRRDTAPRPPTTHGSKPSVAAAAREGTATPLLRLASRSRIKVTSTKAELLVAQAPRLTSHVQRTVRQYDSHATQHKRPLLPPPETPLPPPAAATAASACPLLPSCSPLLLTAEFHSLSSLCDSGESVLFKLQCHGVPAPLLLLKHYKLTSTRQQECRIFDHLQQHLPPADFERFVRQRHTPSAALHQSTANELYGRFTVRPVDKYRPEGPCALVPRHEVRTATKVGGASAVVQAQAALKKARQMDTLIRGGAAAAGAESTREMSHAHQLSRYGSFFVYYEGVLSDVILRQRTVKEAVTSSFHTADWKLQRRSQRRRDWFWQAKSGAAAGSSSSDAADGDVDWPAAGDPAAMSRKSLRFVLHCLQGLAAHHAAGVLLGDIKPANLFYDQQRECRPRWGDYGHAANVLVEHGRGGADSRIHRAPPSSSSTPTAAASSSSNSSSLDLLSSVLPYGIGTWPYQSSETFLRRFDVTSDGYALALSLLEMLVGMECDAHTLTVSKPTQENIAESRRAYAQGPMHEQLRAFAQPLYHNDESPRWDHVHQCAVLPHDIVQHLLRMTHPLPAERPSMQTVIQAVQAALVTSVERDGNSNMRQF